MAKEREIKVRKFYKNNHKMVKINLITKFKNADLFLRCIGSLLIFVCRSFAHPIEKYLDSPGGVTRREHQ